MNHDEFVKLLEERGNLVYILDKGLIRFAKFALTLLAMVGLIGAFVVGFDIKKASEEAKDARFDTQETLLKLTEAKQNLAKTQEELNATKNALNAAKDELNTELAGTKQKIQDTMTELDKTKADYEKFVSDAEAKINTSLEEASGSAARAFSIEQQAEACMEKVRQTGSTRDCKIITASTTISADGTAQLTIAKVNVAVVSQVKELQDHDLTRVVAALQKQVSHDLKPTWNVDALLTIFKTLEAVPKGYWPLVITKEGLPPGAGGFHLTNNGLPFAYVGYFSNWTIDASHELLGMLVDPLGERTIPVPSPNPADNGKIVNMLIEVPQPVESYNYSYRIDGVQLSDFVIPEFYNPSAPPGVKFSYTQAAKAPLKILKGGYFSWSTENEFFQETWFDGENPIFRSLGKTSN